MMLFITCIGPREDATRIGSACVVRRQVVDISLLRRVNQAIYGYLSAYHWCMRVMMRLRGLARLIVKDEDLMSGYSVLVKSYMPYYFINLDLSYCWTDDSLLIYYIMKTHHIVPPHI
ncbi:putative ribosomal protein S5/S7 [Helianthus anomalus]